jgi:hypothetical protein
MGSWAPVVYATDPEGLAWTRVELDGFDTGRAKLQRYRIYIDRRLPGARSAASTPPDVGKCGGRNAATPRATAPPRCLRKSWIWIDGLETRSPHNVGRRSLSPLSVCHMQIMH